MRGVWVGAAGEAVKSSTGSISAGVKKGEKCVSVVRCAGNQQLQRHWDFVVVA